MWGELHGSRQKKTFGCRVLDCFCCRSYIHSALGPYHLLYCGGTEGNHLGLVVKEGNARTSRLCCNVSWRCWRIGCRVSLWGVGDILNSKPLNSRTYNSIGLRVKSRLPLNISIGLEEKRLFPAALNIGMDVIRRFGAFILVGIPHLHRLPTDMNIGLFIRTYFPTYLDIDVVHFEPFPPRDGMWTVVEPHGDSIWTIKQATEMEWTRRSRR